MSEIHRLIPPKHQQPLPLPDPKQSEPTHGQSQKSTEAEVSRPLPSRQSGRVGRTSARVEELTPAILAAIKAGKDGTPALFESELKVRLAADGVQFDDDELGLVLDQLVDDGVLAFHPRYGLHAFDPAAPPVATEFEPTDLSEMDGPKWGP